MTDTIQPTDAPLIDAQPAQLQLQDIVVAVQAISTASARGAYRTEEFSKVGASYDRIVSFLEASGALPAATPPAK